ncbi:MAG: hypothetical protein LBK03_00975, partial [Bacteroidales bacterium]|nr:hypothetical protein [Bacteroidales bacterium]
MKQNRKEKTEKYHDNSIKVWVLPKQKAAIKGQAAKAGLSVAEYLRKVGMGYPIKSVVDREQIAELSKCRADLGRLGGLLKLWLSPDGVSIHSQLHPPTDSVSADRNRVDCPLPEGRGYWEGMPGFA